jgi:hypothetical protein
MIVWLLREIGTVGFHSWMLPAITGSNLVALPIAMCRKKDPQVWGVGSYSNQSRGRVLGQYPRRCEASADRLTRRYRLRLLTRAEFR